VELYQIGLFFSVYLCCSNANKNVINGMVFLGSWAAFLLLQTRRVESDHNTFTQFSSESLANFRQAVHVLVPDILGQLFGLGHSGEFGI